VVGVLWQIAYIRRGADGGTVFTAVNRWCDPEPVTLPDGYTFGETLLTFGGPGDGALTAGGALLSGARQVMVPTEGVIILRVKT